jgi:enamine deaminase RidA (YjgF/YER057c/UK114 family)
MLGPDGHVPVGGFAEQVELSFDNLGVALRSAGLDYADVFQLRTYIVDHSPEKLAVVGLALPEMSFEVDAIAVRP